MPQGYRARGDEDGEGRLLYYYATEWDSVEAIVLSGKYRLVGEDEWSADWDEEEEGFSSYSYHMDACAGFASIHLVKVERLVHQQSTLGKPAYRLLS